MNLNYDCVRELLLTLEELLTFGDNLSYQTVSFSTICDKITDFTSDEIAYTTLKLIEAEYISARVISANNSFVNCIYSSITFEGHQYLDSIRNSKVWETIKKKSLSITFDIVKKLAENYAMTCFKV